MFEDLNDCNRAYAYESCNETGNTLLGTTSDHIVRCGLNNTTTMQPTLIPQEDGKSI
eukprot:UN25632